MTMQFIESGLNPQCIYSAMGIFCVVWTSKEEISFHDNREGNLQAAQRSEDNSSW